ncbi:SDR family NAD(P)-dependent oxidoreductase [Rhabdothermincola salaria]|uniref:SDR family NAD(P)-dependent oxidoreductase n=1 Tax=Rhabdothermincola salaria TaxID=2903142 RepID=UPI001E543BCE|nr:SDR family oxidoreductase [Rhabdothermincola salaria]MCD9623660.1 SDR family oxidoreductase [Rhabdothermincola salaria]
MSARTAMVTGASRGIGRATAIALAEAGFDVAITARTVKEGDATARTDDPAIVLPGSLESTAAEIEGRGQRAVQVPLDLLEREALWPAVDAAIEGLGHLDVVVNNAIYVSPAGSKPFLDTDPDEVVKLVWGDFTAQLLLLQRTVGHMVERGGGTVVNIGSGSGKYKLRRPIGKGGAALTYAAVKAGFHRVADRLANEYGRQGIVAYTIDPGYVATERTQLLSNLSDVASRGVDPSVVGAAVAWLVTAGPTEVDNGSYHEAQDIARALGLLPPLDEGTA